MTVISRSKQASLRRCWDANLERCRRRFAWSIAHKVRQLCLKVLLHEQEFCNAPFIGGKGMINIYGLLRIRTNLAQKQGQKACKCGPCCRCVTWPRRSECGREEKMRQKNWGRLYECPASKNNGSFTSGWPHFLREMRQFCLKMRRRRESQGGGFQNGCPQSSFGGGHFFENLKNICRAIFSYFYFF